MADPTKPVFKKPDFARAGKFGKVNHEIEAEPQVRINFFMDESMHTALKTHAAKNRLKLKEILNELVADYLNKLENK